MWKTVINLFKQDNLYQQALDETFAMLDLDWKMFNAAVKSLRESDTGQIEMDVLATDKQVNAYERDVRKKVMTHLTIAGGADLASGLILVSVIIDVERIGDLTKGIYELAVHHPGRLHGGSQETALQTIEADVNRVFRDMIQAFKESDEDLARELMADYKQEISSACDAIIQGIVSGKVTDLSSADAAALALYVRFLKRIAAHCRNIVSSVVNPFHRLGYKEKPVDS